MNQVFDDLLQLGEPRWWDEHGVPRFKPFRPDDVMNIYAEYVALMEVACQECGRIFKVAVSFDHLDVARVRELRARGLKLPVPGDPGDFYYGDPPRHGVQWPEKEPERPLGEDECLAGDTMSTIPIRVLELWHNPTGAGWRRLPEHEVVVVRPHHLHELPFRARKRIEEHIKEVSDEDPGGGAG